MSYTINLAITTSNSIKLQASSLAQLTQTTNQLTRTALVRDKNKKKKENFENFNRRLHRINVINYLLLYMKCQQKFHLKMFNQQLLILFNVQQMF